MKAASGVPQQKQKQDGNCSRSAPKSAAGSCADGAADHHLAGQHDLLISPACDPLGRGGHRALELARADGRCGSRPREVGCGSSSGSGSRAQAGEPRRERRRPSHRRRRRDATTALTREERLLSAAAERELGQAIEAGANEDQGDEPPPSGSKAKPPVQTGPAPAGQPGAARRRSRLAQSAGTRAATSREAILPARGRLVGDARAPPAQTRGPAAPSRTSDPTPAARRTPPRRGRSPRPAP